MATLHSFLSSLLVGRCLATICMLVLFSRGGEATGCSAEQQLNGSLTYHLNETVKVSQNDYNWRINDDVHANEEDFNKTTIQSRGPHYVNFNKCYHNVSYKNGHTGKIIDCPYNCSIKPLPGVSVAKEETPSPSQVYNSTVAKEPEGQHRIREFVIIPVGLFLLVLIGLMLKAQWAPDRRDARRPFAVGSRLTSEFA